MLCILPFEVAFYKKFAMDVVYVGNPLKDAIANYTFQQDFIAANNLPQKPIIAILPGSRKMELLNILPTMLAVQNHFPNHQFIVAAAPGLPASFYEQFNLAGAKLLFNCTYDILANAELAMVTSGTATLETALLNVPQVVCYKANALSVFIARLLVKIKYISLVNLIADQQIVTELIQQDCTVVNIAQALKAIAVNEVGRSEQLAKYQTLQQMVGPEGASLRAASAIHQFVNAK
jgi:lipid-A-disaccharide synthase